MSDRRTITVQGRPDVKEARMHVRTLAREAGLDLFDQSRISLATSTVAIILGMEKVVAHGQITMGQVNDGGRIGVQVVCTRATRSLPDLANNVLNDAGQMVDDFSVESMAVGGY
jgi:hypothetical protein